MSSPAILRSILRPIPTGILIIPVGIEKLASPVSIDTIPTGIVVQILTKRGRLAYRWRLYVTRTN